MKTLIRFFAISAAALALTAAHAQDKPRVEMKTSVGTIVIELEPAAAPKSVANFLEYVKSGFYEGTVFHRVSKASWRRAVATTKPTSKKKPAHRS